MLSCNGLLVRREWGACIEFESKLLIRQAASVEPSRGSHQYRATHRNWKEGSELSSQRHPLGYRKDLRLALYFLHLVRKNWSSISITEGAVRALTWTPA